jgi:hypothetical protein
MANAVWPATLPSFVQEAGYDESLPDVMAETNMDSGPAKTRPRFTTANRRFAVTVRMDAAQAVIFEGFWDTTLKKGALSFDWVHPRTRATMTFRFRKPAPKPRPFGGDAVDYAMNLESQP